MCGILCQICYSRCCLLNDLELQQRIENRGPNSKHQSSLYIDNNHINITLRGAVLWTQGHQITCQPMENQSGILLFNGDIFDQTWDSEISDTEQIMEKFSKINYSSYEIIKEIRKFKGPFSLIYYNKLTQELIFTRDRIGRNSLLFYKINQCIIISSVLGRNYECVEIPTTNVYILNLKECKLTLFSWDDLMCNDAEAVDIDEWLSSVKLLQKLPDEQFNIDYQTSNVLCEDNVVTYIKQVTLEYTDKHTFMRALLQDEVILKTVQEIIHLLNLSVKVRVEKQPQKCDQCLNNLSPCTHSCIGILFSGGLDCTLLAYLADKYVSRQQSIDLINVAFNKDNNATFDVPDRLTGIQSLEELKQLCPDRKWIFKEVNIPKDVLIEKQGKSIADLVYPRQTILDESLGSALWFAAKGEDICQKSPCRILLLGSGADELFGGYTRHRNAFRRGSWKELDKELFLDWKRISFRNLARDNRVICDHGRQPRMPYLDEDFANYVLGLKPWLKCFPDDSLGPGIGDKLFLRLVAFNQGLVKVALFPKRALQFGSRIANKKERGSDLSKNFKNVIKN
ncbi:hypothetical protein ACJJTC_011899 [Scirpophaga incertulas]